MFAHLDSSLFLEFGSATCLYFTLMEGHRLKCCMKGRLHVRKLEVSLDRAYRNAKLEASCL